MSGIRGHADRARALILCVFLLGLASVGPSQAQSEEEAEPRDVRAPAIREVVRLLRHEGLQPRDRTGDLPAESLEHLDAMMKLDGAADVALIDVLGEDYVIAMYFHNQWARDQLVDGRPASLVCRDVVLRPDQCRPGRWRQIVAAVTRRGGELVEPDGVKAAILSARLRTLRARIEIHCVQREALPDFERLGWRELIGGGLDPQATVNPLSTCLDPARIEVIDQPDATGLIIDREDAGWVWNRVDRVLYPAGVTLGQVDQMIDEYNDARKRLERTRLKTARHGTDLMKTLVIQRQLEVVRLQLKGMRTIANLEAGHVRTGLAQLQRSGVPTLVEVQAVVSPNPFNGSDRVQSARWNGDAPPVSGTAGWNYDRQQLANIGSDPPPLASSRPCETSSTRCTDAAGSHRGAGPRVVERFGSGAVLSATCLSG
jgi:hypothetical protein